MLEHGAAIIEHLASDDLCDGSATSSGVDRVDAGRRRRVQRLATRRTAPSSLDRPASRELIAHRCCSTPSTGALAEQDTFSCISRK